MVDRFYGYQYDTNPRKLSPEHIPYRNRYPKKEEPEKYIPEYRKKQITHKNENVNTNSRIRVRENKKQSDTQGSRKNKTNIKPKLRIVMFLITGFSVLFAISYQNSLISESFNKKEQYKKEMEALSKTNQQIEVNIENSLNLKNIEEAAKDKIGMQKLNNNQKIYVELPKKDYVAPAAEQVIIDDDLGFFEKLIKGFTKSVE